MDEESVGKVMEEW